MALILLSVPAAAADPFAGGDGTPSSPYQIASAEQWVALGADPNLWDKHFVLIRDLDMRSVEPNAVQPIGEAGPAPFVGVFDGGGHTIKHLRIVRPDWGFVGAFEQIGQEPIDHEEGREGHVRNLHLRDVQIQGRGAVGGLIGELSNGSIRNCSVTGTVTGGEFVGGLVGWAHGPIRACTVNVRVRGTLHVGGLVGSTDGMIDSCVATVDVHGTDLVGGLVGDTSLGTGVSRCSSSGRVSGRQGVGGLAGMWSGSMFTGGVRHSSANPQEQRLSRIIQCRSDCAVQGAEEAGGLVGLAYGMGSIEDCYALGPVTGEKKAGGLIGRRVGCCVVRCFAAGAVKGREDIGGLIGKSDLVEEADGLEDYPSCQCVIEEVPVGAPFGSRRATRPGWRLIYRPAVLACFWDTKASGVDSPLASSGDETGMTSLATAQMAETAPFREQGWDFQRTWTMSTGQSYPRLCWELAP